MSYRRDDRQRDYNKKRRNNRDRVAKKLNIKSKNFEDNETSIFTLFFGRGK